MCLAVPGRITEIGERGARVDYGGGLVRDAGLDLLPAAKVGDYVLVHAGYAISLLDEAEALKTLSIIREMGGVGI
ncbi:MAG: HypC/HybG/HupF family hydrogenase formation chaperone [Planctomycetota bacterium]